MATNNVVELQTSQALPRPQGTDSGTNLITPPQRVADSLDHFPEEVYDLSAESHLVRFMKVLLGDSGAGQLRKRYVFNRLQQTLSGSHFFDLDHFYGALFGMQRKVAELLPGNPYFDTATSDEWDVTHSKDASYRSRIQQFARAISWGATPTGMELVAEAVLGVDCDVYESLIQADSSYRTYEELETLYGDDGTYGDMEGLTYSVLEGEGLPRVSGNERRQFVVRPKKEITLEDAHHLSRVLDKLRPADTRYLIEWQGSPVHTPIDIQDIRSDSTYWEVIGQVATSPLASSTPYQLPSTTPTEQPRPPFTSYAGEAWSYGGDIATVVSFYRPNPDSGVFTLPTERIRNKDGTHVDFPASAGLMPRSYVLAGRGVSDGVFVSHPYAGSRTSSVIATPNSIIQQGLSLSTLYADRIPLSNLITFLTTAPQPIYQTTSGKRYWATPERSQSDVTEEILEVRLTGSRLVNYLTFDVAHFPHTASIQVYNPETGVWDAVWTTKIRDSVPKILTPDKPSDTHSQHDAPGHFSKVSVRIDPVNIEQLRIVLKRGEGESPKKRQGRSHPKQVKALVDLDYSLAIRNFDLGYRVTSRTDVPAINPIGTARDLIGSLVQFNLRELPASGLLSSPPVTWRCEPQPVNYAVVSLYLDVRDEDENPQVLDRIYLDPTHSGPHLSVYYSSNDGGFDPDDLFWTPVGRDYTLQKGYVHLPPTKARYLKLEFTNLTAEPYESFLPITRKVKLFPPSIVEANFRGRGIAEESLPDGINVASQINTISRYRSALVDLKIIGEGSRYTATESLFVQDPIGAARLRDRSWVFGFIPWQEGSDAPRFPTVCRHVYDEVEVKHTTKLAFFVGLNSIAVYRLDFSADDDSEVYRDVFHDDLNLSPGYSLTFQPNQLTSGSSGVEATSSTYESRNLVRAIQFATQQSQPIQLVPDDDFRDPLLGSSTFTDSDSWHRLGDAQIIPSVSDDSIVVVRHVVAPLRPLGTSPGPVRGLVEPVFSFRPLSVADEEAADETFGGIESPIIPTSPAGRIWAAARVTVESPLSSPLILQIVAVSNDTVLAEEEVTAHQGELLEWYQGYDIGSFSDPSPPVQTYQYRSGIIDRPVQRVFTDPPATVIPPPPVTPPTIDTLVRVRLIQRGKANDTWKVDTLSLFDESITWEFSPNGGADFYPAIGIKNNANGVLTFPTPGNQLVWRVKVYRPGMVINSIQVRPWYAGIRNARLEYGPQRGPNVSTYDQVAPITEDPEFTTWTRPIPRSWFAAYKRLVAEATVTHVVSRYLIRLAQESVGVLDQAVGVIFRTGYGGGGYGEGPYGLPAGYGSGAYGEDRYGDSVIASNYGDGGYGEGVYGSQ